MDNERLPIKFFAPREIDELRVEGNRNQEPPRWLLTGQDLIDRLKPRHMPGPAPGRDRFADRGDPRDRAW